MRSRLDDGKTDEVSPPFILVKPFVHGQPRTSVPTVFVVYSTVDREILIVLFVLKCSLCWDHLIRHGEPCHLPQGEGNEKTVSDLLPLKLSFNFN